MSLETTIADLVSAANNLTSAVNSKMGEIDQKVDDVASSFSSAIKEASGSTFYVDQASGNDTNSGSSSNPLKTLKEANDRMIPGGAYIVYLVTDYVMDQGNEMHPPTNAMVRIQGLKGDNTKAVVTSKWSLNNLLGGNIVIGSVNQSNGCSFYFKDIRLKLELAGIDDQEVPVFGRQCFVRTNAGTSPSVRMDVQFDDCDLSDYLDTAKAYSDGGGATDAYVMEMQTNVVGLILKSAALSADDVANRTYFVRDRDMNSVNDKIVTTNNTSVFRTV